MTGVERAAVDFACERVSVRRGGRDIVKPTTFRAKAGEVVVISGPNGSGKSSLLDALTGALPMSTGTLRLRTPTGTAEHPTRTYAAGTGRLFQSTRLFRSLSVFENLLVAATSGARYRPSGPNVLQLAEAVSEVERTLRTSRYAMELSAGQERVVSLLCVALSRPWLLLLDEPFAAMDSTIRPFAESILGRFLSAGASILLVEHLQNRGTICPDRVIDMGGLH